MSVLYLTNLPQMAQNHHSWWFQANAFKRVPPYYQ
jgi:hypothetical protein